MRPTSVVWAAAVAGLCGGFVEPAHAAAWQEGCARLKDGDYVYEWCHERSMRQHHYHVPRHIGRYRRTETGAGAESTSTSTPPTRIQHFHDGNPCDGGVRRSGRVTVQCCNALDAPTPDGVTIVADSEGRWPIPAVTEPTPCEYHMTVCDPSLCTAGADDEMCVEVDTADGGTICGPLRPKDRPRAANRLAKDEYRALREKVVEMFDFAMDAYMEEAFPDPEIRPSSCVGGGFGFTELPGLTLLDALDTLVVMGKVEEFQHGVDEILQVLPAPGAGASAAGPRRPLTFDYDITVSVFETTIRVLGGLLSAHMLAASDRYNITTPLSRVNLERYAAAQREEHKTKYPYAKPLEKTVLDWEYEGGLLELAVDLADRLSKAFPDEPSMGVPYGAVNLRYGVPMGETSVSSLAGAGSLSIEFVVTSLLSGDPKYGRLGVRAAAALFRMRSSIGLVGKHIDIDTYTWSESGSGLGTNSDSFYEYLLKTGLILKDAGLWAMFEESYEAIMAFVRDGPLYADVMMYTGSVLLTKIEGLAAFWPGVQTLVGDFAPAADTLNAMMTLWRDLLFLPEGFDYKAYMPGSHQDASYLLRPELIESLVYMQRATGDVSWATPAKGIIHAIEQHCKAKCGYTTVSAVQMKYDHAPDDPDFPGWSFQSPRKAMQSNDNMPSYFLSETLKYLYLLLDDAVAPGEHWMLGTDEPWVLSTEAHPFPLAALHRLLTPEMQASITKHRAVRAAPLRQCPLEDPWAESYDPSYQLPRAPPKEKLDFTSLSVDKLKRLVQHFQQQAA